MDQSYGLTVAGVSHVSGLGGSMDRTRDQILAELKLLRHEAGRMTVKDPGYEPLHDEINALLYELETMP